MATFNSYAITGTFAISEVQTQWDSGVDPPWIFAMSNPVTVQAASQIPELTAGTPVPPSISIISPAEGMTISRHQAIVFEIQPGALVTLSSVVVSLLQGGGSVEEMVHDGVSFSNTFNGAPNVREEVEDGYRFTVRRLGGWHGSSVTLRIVAVDTYGNVAQKTPGEPLVLYTWPVAVR